MKLLGFVATACIALAILRVALTVLLVVLLLGLVASFIYLSCCRFRGHRDKVFMEPEGDDATTEVQPRVQA